MGLFDVFKPALPEVPVTEASSDLVHARVEAMVAGGGPEGVVTELRALVEQDLFGLAPAFVEGLGTPREELASELYLMAWVGFCQACQDHELPREDTLELLRPYQLALREYVAFGQRERYDAGPGPILNAADKLAVGGRDPRHVALGFLAMRLGVRGRRGAVEGLMRLAVLAQMGGYGVGELAWTRRA
jgi:hypothetical protein